MKSLPVSVEALIDMLDQDYPDKCPSLDHPDRQIWFKAGQRSVVTRLKFLADRADKNRLEQD